MRLFADKGEMNVWNMSRLRHIRAGVAIALALMIAAALVLSVPAPEEAVAVIGQAPEGAPACGVLSVPAAGVKATLFLLQEGNGCACELGLYGGGFILGGDADTWAGLALGDAAILRAENAKMALELVEIDDCIRLGDWLICPYGIVRPHGDVLLCVQRAPPWIVRVYRWTML